MLSDLRQFLAGQAVLAHPATSWYRAAKVVRRRPVLATVVAACVLGVAGSAVVSTVLAVRLAARSEALAAAVRQSAESAAERVRAAAVGVGGHARDTLNSISESMAAAHRAGVRGDAARWRRSRSLTSGDHPVSHLARRGPVASRFTTTA
jgi:hypothetical protein